MRLKKHELPLAKHIAVFLILALMIMLKPQARGLDSQKFTEKFLFDEANISVLEENIEMKFNKELEVEKTIEYLIKNISDRDEILAYFATANRSDDIRLTLNDIELPFENKFDNTKESKIPEFENQNLVEISVPISSSNSEITSNHIVISNYPQIYSYRLPLKNGEFGKIRLSYRSENIIIYSEELIHPVHTQIHQVLPARYFVNGAVVNLKLEIPDTVSIRSNHPLQKISEKSYHATPQKALYSNWVVNLISTDGLWFMSNFRKENNENLLKTLAATFLFSFILFLVRRRELTKNKRSEFAQLKANIFGGFSFLLYLTGIGILYFYKLPAYYEKHWNLIYGIIVAGFICLSYLAYKYRHKFNIHFSE